MFLRTHTSFPRKTKKNGKTENGINPANTPGVGVQTSRSGMSQGVHRGKNISTQPTTAVAGTYAENRLTMRPPPDKAANPSPQTPRETPPKHASGTAWGNTADSRKGENRGVRNKCEIMPRENWTRKGGKRAGELHRGHARVQRPRNAPPAKPHMSKGSLVPPHGPSSGPAWAGPMPHGGRARAGAAS